MKSERVKHFLRPIKPAVLELCDELDALNEYEAVSLALYLF